MTITIEAKNNPIVVNWIAQVMHHAHKGGWPDRIQLRNRIHLSMSVSFLTSARAGGFLIAPTRGPGFSIHSPPHGGETSPACTLTSTGICFYPHAL